MVPTEMPEASAAAGFSPAERIASRPASPRDSARLLVVRRGVGIEHRRVRELDELLDPGDLLVVNETRVVPARIHGRLARTGRRVEMLFLRESGPGVWLAWARGARSVRPDDEIAFDPHPVRARVLGRCEEAVELAIRGDVVRSFLEDQGVDFTDSSAFSKLENTEMAARGAAVTVLVRCIREPAQPAPAQ